jgi:hypothetical protein
MRKRRRRSSRRRRRRRRKRKRRRRKRRKEEEERFLSYCTACICRSMYTRKPMKLTPNTNVARRNDQTIEN